MLSFALFPDYIYLCRDLNDSISPMPANDLIVLHIRKALQKKQMTQRDLAVALEKKETEISRWMNGKTGISKTNIIRLEHVLGVNLMETFPSTEETASIKLGLIGTGSIARRFVSEARYVEKITIAAAFNPDREKAREFCEEFHIPMQVSSIEELFENVDAIYIASPCNSHYDYALSALKFGRHVLCEIPLTDSTVQTQQLYDLANKKGLVFMMALKTAYAPSFGKIIETANSGTIGQVVDVSASVTTLLDSDQSTDYNNERMRENTYYALFIALKLLGNNIKKTEKFLRKNNNRLEYFNASLLFKNAVANIKIGTGVKFESSLVIAGTKGYIYVPAPWWKPDYFEIRFENPLDNKRMYFPYESSGLRYEIKYFMDKISDKPTAEAITTNEIIKISRFIDKHLTL